MIPQLSTPENMTLDPNFVFSQSSLQDYLDCRQRFYLRYVQRVIWPALESEPALEHERFVLQGERFHHLAHQYLIGVPSERLRASIQDEQLRLWFENFIDFAGKARLADFARLYPETSLTATLGERKLIAKYDLLAWQEGGRFVIYDWKTSARQPGRPWLAERVQTRLYPMLLAMSAQTLNKGEAVDPAHIEMVYWYAERPDEPLRFPYSAPQYQTDQTYLVTLIAEILSLAPDQFGLTEQERRCAFCVYRSLCGRGERAGLETEQEDETLDEGADLSGFDFEQIAEIAF